MKTNRFYKYAAIILLLINISLVTFFVIKKKRNHNPGHLHAVKTLNLTDDQADQFKALAEEHHQSMMSMKEQQIKLLDAYFSALYKEVNVASNKDMAALTDLEAKKISLTYNHFLEVKQLLTPDQQKNYQKFIENTVKKVLGGKGKKRSRK